MDWERITSRRNPLLQYVRELQRGRKERRKAGEYIGDGLKLLDEALCHGADITAVICSDGMALPDVPEKTRRLVVPEDVMAFISPMETPQGALFVAKLPDLKPPAALTGRCYLVLDTLQDPGNLGTIWRTADAFGADGLLLVNACADPYGPKTVRATMGAAFRLPVWETDLQELTALLDAVGLPLYATALREDTIDVRACDLSRGAVVIGSEGKGVSLAVLEHCGKTLRIPMEEQCESLNAAAAAAVILWEMYRGR
ncbi:MAG: RNA methyltransferase [Oscillospiraceae bacterium]|nr:RNA methyltransferase [Oscillospiraceae bacterium]